MLERSRKIVLVGAALASPYCFGYSSQLSGFISQSVIYTTDNNFFGQTDDRPSFDYSSAAVMYRIGDDRKSLSTQILSRHAAQTDDGKPRVDYLFSTFVLRDTPNFNDHIEIGRTTAIYGLHNEVRSAPYTMDSIFLAQSTYTESQRTLLLFADGIKYSGEYINGPNDYVLKLFAGKSATSTWEAENILGYKVNGELTSKANYAASLQFNYDFTYRVALTAGHLEFGFDPDSDQLTYNGEFNPLNRKGDSISFYKTLSIEYTSDPWIVTAEVQFNDQQQTGFSSMLGDEKLTFKPLSRYVQAIYRLKNVFICVRHDELFANRSDRWGRDFEETNIEGTALGKPAFSRFTIDNMIGLSWNYNSWLFRGEVHSFKGAEILVYRENPSWSDVSKSWTLAVIQANYRF